MSILNQLVNALAPQSVAAPRVSGTSFGSGARSNPFLSSGSRSNNNEPEIGVNMPFGKGNGRILTVYKGRALFVGEELNVLV